MFSKAGSKAISDTYTAVRLLGGRDMTDEGRAFATRYGVTNFPTLLALTADGAVVGEGFQRDLAGILTGMKTASAADADFRAKAKALAAKPTPDALRTMAGLYKQRRQWADARARYEAISSTELLVDDKVALSEVLAQQGDVPARKALLSSMIRTHRSDARHLAWRIALAEADADVAGLARAEELTIRRRRLEALPGAVTDTPQVAGVRARLAEVASAQRDREAAMAHWDWILAHAPTSKAAIEALHGKGMATIHRGYGRGDLAEVKAGRALLQRLVDEHPTHATTEGVRRLLVQVDMIVKQLEARAKADGG